MKDAVAKRGCRVCAVWKGTGVECESEQVVVRMSIALEKEGEEVLVREKGDRTAI